MNSYDTMLAALQEARHTMQAADESANALMDILIGVHYAPNAGRLRHVSGERLKRLKAALQKFDAQKQEWKD